MTKQNPFLLPVDEYTRNINPIGDWLKQSALYISRIKNLPYEHCVQVLKSKVESGEIAFRNPQVLFYERGDNGDRHRRLAPLRTYLKETLDQGHILVPTGTTYLHHTQQESHIVGFLDEGVANRSKYKKLSQKYGSEGNIALKIYYHNNQDAEKRTNNAVSGNFVAEGSVINNPTGHSTLTSMTRSMSSLSNASNERLIEGNRHYYTPQIALNNLISIVSITDQELITSTVEHFGLAYPNVDQVMKCIHRSTDLYFIDRKAMEMIRDFVQTLTPAECAAVVYTGDLYHLKEFNDGFIREMVRRFSRVPESNQFEDPVEIIKGTDELIVNYAHQVAIDIVEGIGKDYSKLLPEKVQIVAGICKNIETAIDYYRPLLKAFFLTRNAPCTIATIQSQIRRSVVLSDTDSTMFSVDSWVEWYFGELRFTPEAYGVAGSVMFMATQCIAHILAQFSANMNVEKKRLFTLSMKPEYVFPVFAQTSVAKHYYTCMKVKEGHVFRDIDMEIKGVHLKDSSIDTGLIKEGSALMEKILRTVMSGKKIEIIPYLKELSQREQELIHAIRNNDLRYMKRTKIKDKSAYSKGPELSPYQFYLMWEECFEKKYGPAPPPPYTALRIPVQLKNRTQITEWLAGMEDREVATRLAEWIKKFNKKTMTSIPVPMDLCVAQGLPLELQSIMDMKRIILALTKSRRIVMESLGVFAKSEQLFHEMGY